ncbi:outer membrane beta-barrel protein [Fusobacterium sp.]|uniref:outer membrane beta-barrel protein n=1 Tax=Fusobacterium sp. TaxID=68766 RepID=UPI00261678C6|nr:outer membrane beta-barrel protein [Fusobacterium sp.]
MKKILLGMTLLSTVAMGAEGTNLYLRAGADINGKFDVVKPEASEPANKRDAKDFGYEFSTEITKEIYKDLEIGVGISYQDHGSPERLVIGTHKDTKLNMPKIKSTPVYFTTKYNLPVNTMVKPYLKADLGYSFNSISGKFKVEDFAFDESYSFPTEIKDGAYFGIGAGIEYNNLTADIMYKINKSKIKIETPNGTIKDNLDYSRITLSVGYKFNF